MDTKIALESGNLASWDVVAPLDMTMEDASPAKTRAILIQFPACAEFSHTFDYIGEYLIRATLAESGEVQTFTVTSKIIRFELRTLSEAHRTIYFDALHTFYNTGQEEGELKFGPAYMSLQSLLRQHLYGAASKDCDHWHDDAGILNHHIGITWQMEKSLRMINPETAAHYWDYTIESFDGVAWYDSVIFDDNWYGRNSPSNHDHVIDTGMWAYTRVMEKAWLFSNITNPYGLLRSPWNTNPTPFLMRHNKTLGVLGDAYSAFPQCSDFAELLSVGNSSYAEISQKVNGQLHGSVHIMVGGHWGLSSKWDEATKALGCVADKFLLFSKSLWRQGYIRVPALCSSDTPAEECRSTCPDAILANLTASEVLSKSQFDPDFFGAHASANCNEMEMKDILSEYGLDTADLLQELCSIGYPGEMFSSAAPQDPLFWPLHGNTERYVQLLRLLNDRGDFKFDLSWGYDHVVSTSDTHIVCDWSGVDTDGTGMPNCTNAVCDGHKADDLLPFSGLLPDQGSKLFTNEEFVSISAPSNIDLPYAYDSLQTWNGCQNASMLTQAGVQIR
uniref:Tyrosinase copper-binding domain-containing protein n=1 Tax=Octactis speculum TaxID=3111310 RepID=A0A7S2GZS8_9STRA